MKALLLPILALGAASVAAAAAPTYPMAATGVSVSIGLETTTMNLDGLDSNNQEFNGLRVGLERIVHKTSSYFMTVNGSIGYSLSHENGATPEGNKDEKNPPDRSTDYTLLTANLGVDWNIKLGEQTYAYAGPRLGWAQYKWEPNAPGEKSDEVSYIGYGAEVGVRYYANSRCSVNASVRTMRYLEEDKVSPLTTSIGVGVNVSF